MKLKRSEETVDKMVRQKCFSFRLGWIIAKKITWDSRKTRSEKRVRNSINKSKMIFLKTSIICFTKIAKNYAWSNYVSCEIHCQYLQKAIANCISIFLVNINYFVKIIRKYIPHIKHDCINDVKKVKWPPSFHRTCAEP